MQSKYLWNIHEIGYCKERNNVAAGFSLVLIDSEKQETIISIMFYWLSRGPVIDRLTDKIWHENMQYFFAPSVNIKMSVKDILSVCISEKEAIDKINAIV